MPVFGSSTPWSANYTGGSNATGTVTVLWGEAWPAGQGAAVSIKVALVAKAQGACKHMRCTARLPGSAVFALPALKPYHPNACCRHGGGGHADGAQRRVCRLPGLLHRRKPAGAQWKGCGLCRQWLFSGGLPQCAMTKAQPVESLQKTRLTFRRQRPTHRSPSRPATPPRSAATARPAAAMLGMPANTLSCRLMHRQTHWLPPSRHS